MYRSTGYGLLSMLLCQVLANRSSDGHLWYMLFEHEDPLDDNEEDVPLLLWLNGGPGASESIISVFILFMLVFPPSGSSLGNLLENGPYRLHPNMSLTENPWSWARLGHCVYFDQPVGEQTLENDGIMVVFCRNWVLL